MPTTSGQVYLVGAGLGDISYLTLKAHQLLRDAEVIIYDALVSPEILQLASSNTLQIDVGKRGGKPSTSQRDINQMLIAYCREGKQVVRLKNGDPGVFGRIQEEIAALQSADCKYEVVPGVSSALAAPLMAGIPLTEKNFGKGFVVISGHEVEELNWKAIAQIDTKVILMGGSTLPSIIHHLLLQGLSSQIPIAIIQKAGTSRQKVWKGTLEDIVKLTEGITLSPAVIVIGEVVKLMSTSHLPLSSKTILVTRAVDQSGEFTQLLQQQGACIIEMPALEITHPSSYLSLDTNLHKLSEFQWLILTSANAVEYFLARLNALGKDMRVLGGIKIAVVGKKTAYSLQKYQIQPDFIPPDYVADSLAAHFPEHLEGKKILFPRVETGGRDVLVTQLTSMGATVVEVAAYQSGCPTAINPEALISLQQRQVDIITFASSKTVQNFYKLLKNALESSEEVISLLEGVMIASIGPQTSSTCHQLWGRVDIEAKEFTLEGLTKAILNKISISL